MTSSTAYWTTAVTFDCYQLMQQFLIKVLSAIAASFECTFQKHLQQITEFTKGVHNKVKVTGLPSRRDFC